LDNQKSSTTYSGTKYDYMSVKGNEKAEPLFKFLSDNSSVEWGRLQYGIASNYLATDHDLNAASGIADRAYRLILSGKGNLINILDHSHVEGEDPHPSGFPESKGILFDPNQSDKANAKWLKNSLPGHSVLQRVYIPSNGEYLRYNSRNIFLPQIK